MLAVTPATWVAEDLKSETLVLLSLYSKMRIGPDRLAELLDELGVGHAFDLISVLSLNTDPNDVWGPNTATRINSLFDSLPN